MGWWAGGQAWLPAAPAVVLARSASAARACFARGPCRPAARQAARARRDGRATREGLRGSAQRSLREGPSDLFFASHVESPQPTKSGSYCTTLNLDDNESLLHHSPNAPPPPCLLPCKSLLVHTDKTQPQARRRQTDGIIKPMYMGARQYRSPSGPSPLPHPLGARVTPSCSGFLAQG
jgi:hypothetical protein